MLILWNLHFQWKWAEVMACLAIDSTHPVPQQVFLVHCAPFLPAGCGAGNAFHALMEKEVHLISASIPSARCSCALPHIGCGCSERDASGLHPPQRLSSTLGVFSANEWSFELVGVAVTVKEVL